jgi:L-rhamnose mutarotase
MRKMAADKTTQDWWKLTKPCFTKYADNSTVEFYTDMEQIFDFAG